MKLAPKNQRTLEEYYHHTNSGDFAGALKFFADDAIYRLPSASPVVPYAGEWRGRAGVEQVYKAFGDAFAFVDMTELSSISTQDELISINDEIFVSKNTLQPWRVAVAHQFQFEQGLIKRLDVHLDLAGAHEALQGRTVLSSGLPPVDAFSNVSTLSDLEAQEIVRRYLAEDAAVDLLDAHVAADLPGDPRRLRFAGSWLGKAEVICMRTHWQNSFEGSIEPVRLVAEGGLVFAQICLHGTFVPTRAPIEEPATILFKLSSERLIERMIWYLNTYPFVALATG